MADQFDALSNDHIEFIEQQLLFFVGTAAEHGSINVSPKGMDTLRVVDANRLVWLNLTGSGNETAAHVLQNDRMTIMFASFSKQPLILRLYGHATVVHPRDSQWSNHLELFDHQPGARQFFEMQIDMVQTSCGFAVPLYDLVSERPTLTKWAKTRGDEGISDYWAERNRLSLDGTPTGILPD